MRKGFYFILLLFPIFAIAQIPVPSWTFVGPTTFPVNGSGQINGIGRVTKIKFDPIQSNKLYATSASGGLWISTDGGDTWTGTGTDQMPSHNEATICIDYSNTNTLYLGTGDPNYYSTGYGVWKSTDGGATFSQSNTGMGNRLVDELLMSPTNHNTLIAATDDGIYKSSNAGGSWVKRFNRSHFTDMDFKPGSNGRVIYACTVDSFYRSDDGGNNWTVVTSGFYIPGGAGGQGLRIAVTPADTNLVYLGMVANRGSLFKSNDGGHSFSIVKDSFDLSLTGYDITDGGQGDYNFDLNVDPIDTNTIYWVSHNNWKSTLGGTPSSWVMLTHWWEKVHTDMHCITFDPFDATKLYNANDGAVWLTRDSGVSWAQKSNGLSCTEIAPAASSRLDKNTISIGTQDNGELYYNGGWITNRGGDWYEYMAYDYLNPKTVYYANGNRRIVSAGDQSLNMPITNDFERIVFSRSDFNLAFAGSDTLLRTRNLNDPSPSWDIITVFGAPVKALALSPADSNKLFVITNDGVLHISNNALSASPSFFSYATPASTYNTAGIEVIPYQPNVVYMYNGSNIYRSIDTGIHWADITYDYPSLDVVGMVHDRFTTDQSIFVANTSGVFYKRDTMTHWENYTGNLPSVAGIQGLDIYNDGSPKSVLRVQYYGRGIWQAPVNTQRELVAANFGSDITGVCVGNAVHFSDSTYNNPTSWSWSFPGGTPSTSSSQTPTVVYSSPGIYPVTLVASNSFSSDTRVKQVYINVYTIDTLPVSEGFEGAAFPPIGWTNYDGGNDSVVWQLSNYGGFGASAHGILFDNFNHDESGKQKSMYFGIDASQYDSLLLSFDVAYQVLQGYSDSLSVTASLDCGETFNRVYAKGGSSLASDPEIDTSSTAFSPSVSQWRKDSVYLYSYGGHAGVIISFNNISGYGTYLYLDNINLSGKKTGPALGIVSTSGTNSQIHIYPNPTKGQLSVDWYNPTAEKTSLDIYNVLGSKVRQIDLQSMNGNGHATIDISDMSNGVYYIKSDMDKSVTTKISLVK